VEAYERRALQLAPGQVGAGGAPTYLMRLDGGDWTGKGGEDGRGGVLQAGGCPPSPHAPLPTFPGSLAHAPKVFGRIEEVCSVREVSRRVTARLVQKYKTVPFDTGDKVRILEKKEKFDKGKQKFSKELYTIDKREGYKLIIKDEKRKLKPSELLKADKISNPISQSYIDNKIKSKEQSKITNKLIRNEDMTKQEALKAKKQLQDNSLPPALSTRSNDRKLRKK
jgi:hypothetical protein